MPTALTNFHSTPRNTVPGPGRSSATTRVQDAGRDAALHDQLAEGGLLRQRLVVMNRVAVAGHLGEGDDVPHAGAARPLGHIAHLGAALDDADPAVDLRGSLIPISSCSSLCRRSVDETRAAPRCRGSGNDCRLSWSLLGSARSYAVILNDQYIHTAEFDGMRDNRPRIGYLVTGLDCPCGGVWLRATPPPPCYGGSFSS